MFSDDEKEYLKKIVKKNLEKFKEDEKDVIVDVRPAFLKGEKDYEAFLKQLLEKLSK